MASSMMTGITALATRFSTISAILGVFALTTSVVQAAAPSSQPPGPRSFAASFAANFDRWFDRSVGIFVPPAQRTALLATQDFSVFWWNFVVHQGLADAPALCARLKALPSTVLARVECEQKVTDFLSIAKDWAEDLPLRQDRPSSTALVEKLDRGLSQATLPVGDPGLLQLLRLDPLESWRELRSRLEKRLKIPLERKSGFFYDSESDRVVIPIQTSFPPAEIEKTREILDAFSTTPPLLAQPAATLQTLLIGPHGSSLRNQDRVSDDLSAVSVAGYLILALTIGGFLITRRGGLLLLFPPVFFAAAGAVVATILVFGSIHGITLALGSGVIGLVIDYGFHAALSGEKRQKSVWKTNLVAASTTLAGLVVLMTSAVPLLRQMMFFAVTGMGLGFFLFFSLARIPKWRALTHVKPFALQLTSGPAKTTLAVALVLASFATLVQIRPDLDLRQFDYHDTISREVSDWLFKKLNWRPPLFSVTTSSEGLFPEEILKTAEKDKAYADSRGFHVENLAQYLPPLDRQQAHAATWSVGTTTATGRTNGQTSDCALLPQSSEPKAAAAFYRPFVDQVLCAPHPPRSTTTPAPAGDPASLVRSYTRHLIAPGNMPQWTKNTSRVLSLWFPETDAQEADLRATHPDVQSLKEAALAFPRALEAELAWMTPLAFGLVLVILLIYYRSLAFSLLALSPFFCGLGLFGLSVWTLGLQLSFISLIALVMSFGLSVDYAIFVVDHEVQHGNEPGSSGVWDAVSTAALSTFLGFVPLLFSKHPVLSHLGQALCISTAGCYVGTVWGIPGMLALIDRMDRRTVRKNPNDRQLPPSGQSGVQI